MTDTGIEFDERHLLALEEQRHTPSARRRHERFIRMLAPTPGERILDLGCGTGHLARLLAPLVAPDGRVTGIDISPDAIRLAARLSGDSAAGVAFQQADGEELPFATASFDAAVCVSVLGFCRRPERVLAELRRVLRPGGRLLIANADEDQRAYNVRDRALGRAVARAIADRAFDPWVGRRLAGLLEGAGFRLTQESVHTDVERGFTPDTAGFIHAHAFRRHVTEVAGIAEADYERWLADLEASDRDGTYSYSVTTYAYLAER